MSEATERLALEHAIRISAQLEVQLTKKDAFRPVLAILHKARGLAQGAISELARVDPENPRLIRDLQNEIAVYQQMVNFVRELIAAGIEADQQISETDEYEIQEVTNMTPEQQAELQKLGVSPTPQARTPDA